METFSCNKNLLDSTQFVWFFGLFFFFVKQTKNVVLNVIYLIGLKIQTIIHHDQNEEGFVFFIDSLNLGMESEMRYNKLCVADE